MAPREVHHRKLAPNRTLWSEVLVRLLLANDGRSLEDIHVGLCGLPSAGLKELEVGPARATH